MVLDFTSALYLGARAVPFPAGLPLTSGKPAVLQEPPWQRAVAQEVARRQGLEAGLLAPSTLHLFWDVFRLAPRSAVVFIDRNMYPVGQWGSIRASLRGLPVVPFAATDLLGLAQQLHVYRQQGRVPWLVTDGWHLTAGRPAPLAEYLALLQQDASGVLLIDDTQAAGVLGAHPNTQLPLGYGGGGSLTYLGIKSAQTLTITSLAKGLGVPVAVLAGSAQQVARFAQRSDVRVHTSPVSNWHAWAAQETLCHDARYGDAARLRLWQRIAQFRKELAAAGLSPAGGDFPVQKLRLPRATAALSLHHYLRERGIHCLLLADECRPAVPQVAFCLRADHAAAEIRRLTQCIRHAACRTSWISFTSTSPSYEPH